MRYAFCALFFLSVLSPAGAGLVELDTSASQFDVGVNNQGWWGSLGGNSDLEDSIQTGNLAGNTLRSFYTFDVSSVAATDTVDSASLTIRLGTTSSVSGTESIRFYDVATDAATLNNNDNSVAIATADAVWADLGSGVDYGTFSVNATLAEATELVFNLNAAGIADIQAAIGGGFFSIGGSMQSGGVIFGGVDTPVKLTLNTTAVPEPSSLLVLGGIGCIAGLRRRRR